MHSHHLLSREVGDLPRGSLERAVQNQLLRSFAAAPQHRFDGTIIPKGQTSTSAAGTDDTLRALLEPHKHGVGALALEKFDGRFLLSGGAEGAINLWDLSTQVSSPHCAHTFMPLAAIHRSTERAAHTSTGHTHGITHLAFYPHDPDAFLSSSFDRTVKLWSTRTCLPAATFDLSATVYSHATSPVGQHVMVACGTQHSHVRLVDLKTRSSVQALVAHGGPVLSTAWSPRREWILASGHADGSARIWDVRMASGLIGLLDAEDSLGIRHHFSHAMLSGRPWGDGPRIRAAAKAHTDAVNSLSWTDDGLYIVTGGLDRKLRVWDASTGANTLASFGSVIQNAHARHRDMVIAPGVLPTETRDLLFWPNENEILMLDLHEGKVLSRLRSPAIQAAAAARGGPSSSSSRSSSPMPKHRITSMVWRGMGGGGRQSPPVMGGSGVLGAMYTGHADGHIRAWMPPVLGPDEGDEEERDDDGGHGDRKKKRKALDDAFKSLMGRHITYT